MLDLSNIMNVSLSLDSIVNYFVTVSVYLTEKFDSAYSYISNIFSKIFSNHSISETQKHIESDKYNKMVDDYKKRTDPSYVYYKEKMLHERNLKA